MPTYCYVCPECGQTQEMVRALREREELPTCACRTVMVRDFGAERANVGDRPYRRPIVSNSLAINPSQIPEHKRLFPDIQITPEGQPIFESYRQHDTYLKKCGFVKNPQTRRPRGTRIATAAK